MELVKCRPDVEGQWWLVNWGEALGPSSLLYKLSDGRVQVAGRSDAGLYALDGDKLTITMHYPATDAHAAWSGIMTFTVKPEPDGTLQTMVGFEEVEGQQFDPITLVRCYHGESPKKTPRIQSAAELISRLRV
jgi:hypothetical protein